MFIFCGIVRVQPRRVVFYVFLWLRVIKRHAEDRESVEPIEISGHKMIWWGLAVTKYISSLKWFDSRARNFHNFVEVVVNCSSWWRPWRAHMLKRWSTINSSSGWWRIDSEVILKEKLSVACTLESLNWKLSLHMDDRWLPGGARVNWLSSLL